jgi:CDP-diacylglycerol pyrophosphatase
MKKKKDWKFIAEIVTSVAVFAVVICLFMFGSANMLNRAKTEGAETLRKSVTRACVQCYAIEGRYPPSVDYITENYGVQLDKDRYNVFYEGFASNLMPTITVIPVETNE